MWTLAAGVSMIHPSPLRAVVHPSGPAVRHAFFLAHLFSLKIAASAIVTADSEGGERRWGEDKGKKAGRGKGRKRNSIDRGREG